jgi:hypothetical protein
MGRQVSAIVFFYVIQDVRMIRKKCLGFSLCNTQEGNIFRTLNLGIEMHPIKLMRIFPGLFLFVFQFIMK